jgi:hypothetical protein
MINDLKLKKIKEYYQSIGYYEISDNKLIFKTKEIIISIDIKAIDFYKQTDNNLSDTNILYNGNVYRFYQSITDFEVII